MAVKIIELFQKVNTNYRFRSIFDPDQILASRPCPAGAPSVGRYSISAATGHKVTVAKFMPGAGADRYPATGQRPVNP
ncbi:hypothetical protein [Wenzhouxiangella limi]|uniref:hypothetical protein n=1 Tax=Wenzhouxiangella limi TaxID=2707351 RepID=UPI0019459A5F|nr:hypothetical protein [Wenzhouxiangella limi]